MPTTKKTLKELRDSLKAMQTAARKLETKAFQDGNRETGFFHQGRSKGIEACRVVVEALCQ